MSERASSVPRPVPLPEAISRSAPLAALAQRLRASEQRYEAVRPALPAGLASQVKPGPIDDAGWTLLAASAAAAAKLRQLLPRLTQVLTEQGWPVLPIRVHITRHG